MAEGQDSIRKELEITDPLQVSNVPESPPLSRTKSVKWYDWELQNVMEFTPHKDTVNLIDDSVQTDDVEQSGPLKNGVLPLVSNMLQTSMEISSLGRSRSSSAATCTSTGTSVEMTDDQQAALKDLITHMEDTAAMLQDYLQPPKPSEEDADYTSYEQTTFLLKYQLALVSFIQARSCGTILQILNMLLVIFATVVLSRQMLKYKVEGKFMAQTYLATVITFAGLYFIIYRLNPDSWEFGSTDKMDDSKASAQYIKMLYLSVSAATLCGAANIQPRSWYAIIILCFQSLINFVYFASILAQTIGNYHSYTVQVIRRSSSMSRLRSVSRS